MQKKDKNAGVAMVVVLIVGAVVMVFCLSLLLAAYTLFSQTNRQVTQEQCKILTQSTAEMLSAELKNPDSALSGYLGTQIQSGKWISEETAKTAEPGDIDADAVSKLVMTLEDGGESGDYHVAVTFSYSLNLPEDDGGDDDDDDDDQDDTGNGGTSGGAESGGTSGGTESGGASGGTESGGTSGGAEPGRNRSSTPRAATRCTRGDGTGRDVQFYELETVFSSVSLKGGAGSEEE